MEERGEIKFNWSDWSVTWGEVKYYVDDVIGEVQDFVNPNELKTYVVHSEFDSKTGKIKRWYAWETILTEMNWMGFLPLFLKRLDKKLMKESELFVKIWKERKHVCGVCKSLLQVPVLPHYFAHVIPKKQYPEYKLLSDNIELLCKDCHYKYDHDTHKAKGDVYFNWLFHKAEELKKKYKRDFLL